MEARPWRRTILTALALVLVPGCFAPNESGPRATSDRNPQPAQPADREPPEREPPMIAGDPRLGRNDATSVADAQPPTVADLTANDPAARVQAWLDRQPAPPPRGADTGPREVPIVYERVDDIGYRASRDGGERPKTAKPAVSTPPPAERAEPDPAPSDPPPAPTIARTGNLPSEVGRKPGPKTSNAPANPNAATPPATSQPAPVASPAPLESPQAISPPKLKGVSVGPATSDAAPADPNRAIGAAVNAPVSAAAPPTIAGIVERWPGLSEDPSFRRQLDRRILQVIAGDFDAAREPLQLVSAEQQEMAARLIETLIVCREMHLGDPHATAEKLLEQTEELTDTLRKLSDLAIPRLEICREVRGYGQYTKVDPPSFPAGVGSEFVVYLELRDFQSKQADDGYYTSEFSLRTAVLAADGRRILEVVDDHIVDRCLNRRRDCFIPRLIRLPATLSPGEYVVKVTVIDKLGEKAAEQRTTIRVFARS